MLEDSFLVEPRFWLLVGTWVGLLAIYWFLLARPRRAALKKHKEFVDALQEGDKVITAGGLYGRIIRVRQEYVVLRVANGVEIKISRQAIRRRQGEKEEDD